MTNQSTYLTDDQMLELGRLVATRIMENAKPLTTSEKQALEIKIDRYIDQVPIKKS